MEKEIIYTFIDNQNLNLGVLELGWKLDYQRFYIYLKEKYKSNKMFLFIGFIEKNKNLYEYLKNIGYILVFKNILINNNGKIKGNVDSLMILNIMIYFNIYNKCIVVTGDGDFDCIVKYLISNNKFYKLIIPNRKKLSMLLKTVTPNKFLIFLNDCKFLENKNTTTKS